MRRTAICCCGVCSIEVEGGPTLNAVCHCSSCRRRTGSAFGWSAYFPDNKVIGRAGDLRIYAKEGAAGYDRYFCERCGTTLFWKSFGFLPSDIGIAGGCFVDDPLPEPNFSASDARRCIWLEVPSEWLRAP